jgi:FdrA protein
MLIKAHVKRNTYFDSITLMKIARSLTDMPGIEDAAAIMATEPNLQLLADAGLTPPEVKANPADVLLVVRASDETTAEAALQSAEEQLTQRNVGAPLAGALGATGVAQQPRSLEQAVAQHPEARLAVISVPGPYAALESERALRAGLHVFLFSDNVPLEDEIALKHLAQERDLLLMGPDCGTAMLNGVGLGFVNVVPQGPIGIVGASGTGIQQVMSLIAQRGSGVSQVIGCGGRDLTEAVGAITTLQGLRLLQADEQTQVIAIISKPPAPSVAERVIEAAATANKPVVVMFVGADQEALQTRYSDRIIIARTLAEAAQQAIALTTGTPRVEIPGGATQNVVAPLVGAMGMGALGGASAVGGGAQRRMVGLFSGGTLCDEAMHIWAKQLGPIYSNSPLNPAWRLLEGRRGPIYRAPVGQGHCAIDFGADEYTRGRPHPMIDPSLRLKRLQEEAGDPGVGVILLDIVLGYCSHPDPATVYAPAILSAREQAAREGRELHCIISLCGTEDDPQRLSVQASKFREAGAEIFTSNADAAMRCIELVM